MAILSQNTFSLRRLPKDPFTLELNPETLSIPANSAGVADLTNAEFDVRVLKEGKELFPNFDESIGGRNYFQYSYLSDTANYTAGAYNFQKVTFKLKPNTRYVYSFDSTIPMSAYWYVINLLDSTNTIIHSTNRNKLTTTAGDSKTFVTDATGEVKFSFYINNWYVPNVPYVIADVLIGAKIVEEQYQDFGLPAIEDILSSATISTLNCTAVISEGKIKITTLTPAKKAGWVDLTVTYGEQHTATKRFTWTLVPEGRSVIDMIDEWAISTSKENAPLFDSFTPVKPTWSIGSYLWKRTKSIYSSGDPTYTTPTVSTEWEAVNVLKTEYDSKWLNNEQELTSVKSRTEDLEDLTSGHKTRIEEAESAISQNADNINLKVSKNGVVSSINQSSESVKIDAEKIEFTGSASFKSASQTVAKDEIDKVQIGSRNYFSINNFVADNKSRGYSTISVIEHEGNIAYRSSNIANNHNIPRYLQGKFETNTQYYFKFNILWESYTNSGAQYVFTIRYTDGTTSTLAATTSQTYRALLTAANKTIDYITTSRQYSGDVIIYNIQLEKANKPSDWRPAIEDVQSDINKAMADANLARAITDKFGTDITGALISTVMVLLREANSQANTAGFSGIQGSLLDQPSYWSGGTHVMAQAFVPFVKKLENGQATTLAEYNNLPSIVFLHNGAAKIGHFIVLTSGEILIIDKSTGVIKLKFTPADLPAIADLVGGTNSSGSTPIGAGSATIASSHVVSGSTSVNKSGATATFNGTSIYLSARGKAQSSGMASSAEAVLYARRNGIRTHRLATAMVFFTNSSYTDETDSRTPVPNYLQLDSGTYTFELVIETNGNVVSGSATTTSSNFSWTHTVAGIKMQQYAKDGMMFFFSNRHFYFNELTGLDVKESDPAKFNLPGVLLSASVPSNGGFSNWWGAKKHVSSTATRNSTGRYTVYHSIGHTNYQISASPQSANRSHYIVSRGVSNFVIEWRTIGSSPALTDTAFDFQITGNNYS